MKIEVKGLRDLQENLGYFSRALQQRILRQALSRAMTPATAAIRKATYTTVKRRTGLLRAGLGARVIKAPQPQGRSAAGVFARSAAKGMVNRLRKAGKLRQRPRSKGQARDITVPFYWRFIEFGTAKSRARPYVHQAFQSAIPAMLETFKLAVARGIERASAQRPNQRRPS